jgi:hypothetical protein
MSTDGKDKPTPLGSGTNSRIQESSPKYDAATDSIVPDDFYRESRNSNGDVVSMIHADGPMVTSAEVLDDQAMFKMTGRPPHKEEGTKEVCIRLAEALSHATGKIWTAEDNAPQGPERGVDWFLFEADGQRKPIQVTRVGPRSRWQKVGSTGTATGIDSADEAAADIWAAIERKLITQDPGTILALHSGQPGHYGFPTFVESFQRTFESQLINLVKYSEVWLVGYSVKTSYRLHPRR